MICRKAFFALLALGGLAAPAMAQTLAAPVEAQFTGGPEEASGTATLTPARNGVLIEVRLEKLPPSTWVALHLHENGVCDHSKGHEAAGGHFNPGAVEHGWLSETGPHAGDLPNLRTDANGVAEAQVFAPLVTWEEGPASVRGRALIIHEKADDYKTQPTGDAGKRLACAVIPAG